MFIPRKAGMSFFPNDASVLGIDSSQGCPALDKQGVPTIDGAMIGDEKALPIIPPLSFMERHFSSPVILSSLKSEAPAWT